MHDRLRTPVACGAMNRHILVSVAWPYASGSRHLGHLAGAYLPADIFARYHRLAGDRVLMVSGSDIYGTPITVRADQEGVTPQEIDVAMIYDSFTITALICLEDLGFCRKGEGGAWVRGGRLRWDSGLRPGLNTDGGGLSSNHPGMRGIFLLIEAVRQLRGESTAQVAGARLAVAHGNGGQLGGRHAAATVILAKD